MELWIRNAEKTVILKAENIYIEPVKQFIDENGNIRIVVCGYEDIAEEVFGVYVNNGIIVGTYKTKERALEVLDEIQKLISNIGKTIIKEKPFKLKSIVKNTIVYEMPLE